MRKQQRTLSIAAAWPIGKGQQSKLRLGGAALGLLLTLLLVALSACGQSASSETETVLPLHYLRGFTVQGLEYSAQGAAGTHSSITDERGGFRTDAAQVRLAIGALVLGTVNVKDVITPLSLPGGAAYQSKVIRLLIALDEDGDASNGITLNASLRERAKQWQYDLSTTDVEILFAAISADVAAANNRTPELPTEAAALAQFAPAFRCVYTGLYSGTMSSVSGNSQDLLGQAYIDSNFALAVSAPFGDVYGQRVSDDTDKPPIISDLQSNAPLTVESTPQFATDADPGLVEYSGQFDSADAVRGGFNQKGAPAWIGFRGNFTGTRLAGAADARYRFVANFVLPDGPRLWLLEITAQNQVSATLASTDGQRVVKLQGTLQANVVKVQSGRYQFSGTLERDGLLISGEFTDLLTGAVISFAGATVLSGCAP